jgi:4-amino-4-deoxy-L-arabinose transferase-like glycosyltransferase
MNDMTKTQRYSFLVGILIIATFLRFFHFTTTPPGLYPDEAMDGNNAAEVVETGHAATFYVEDNGREGLYVNIVAAILKVAPIYEAWVIRLPAAIAGVLTVVGIYFLVDELFGNGPGLLTAFLLATSFWHIMFSRIGFRAILAPLLLTWALYLLIKAFRAASARRGIWLAIAAGVVYSLGFYTYIAYRITPLLFLLFIPFFMKKPGFWKRTAAFIVTTFLVAAPIGYYFVQHPADFFGRTAEISVTNSSNPIGIFAKNLGKELLMLNWRGDSNWRQNISGAPELFWPVGIIFVVGFALGLYALWKSWHTRKKVAGQGDDQPGREDMFPLFSLIVMYVWFALAILPAAMSNEGIPHALRSILMIPPVMTFAALGGVWLYNLAKKYWHVKIAQAIAIVFVLFVSVYGYVNYFIVWAQNPNVPGAFNADYVTIGHEINALPSATPKYVVVTAGGVPERGIPTPAETTMFITHSFTDRDQSSTNIHYLLPDQIGNIPAGTPSEDIFYIN